MIGLSPGAVTNKLVLTPVAVLRNFLVLLSTGAPPPVATALSTLALDWTWLCAPLPWPQHILDKKQPYYSLRKKGNPMLATNPRALGLE